MPQQKVSRFMRILTMAGLFVLSLVLGLALAAAQTNPTFDVSSRLDPARVVVLIQQDGALLFTDSQLTPLATIPAPPVYFVAGGSEVMYLGATEQGVGVTAVKADGTSRFVAPPPVNGLGDVAGFMPSPDGAQLAWLIDTTAVAPTFDGCDPAQGCIGRTYELIVTDGSGGSARTLQRLTIGDPYPYLSLAGWRSDGQALFLKRIPWGVASGFFAVTGGGVLEVNTVDGAIKIRSEAYLVNNEAISPDGRWLARDSVPAWLVHIESQDGVVYELPFTGSLAGELTFSRDSQRLLWAELSIDPGTQRVTGMSIRSMSLADGAVTTLVTTPPPQGEELLHFGAWLTDRLLVFFNAGGIHVLDVASGEVAQWPPASGAPPIVGVVGTVGR